MSVSLEMKLKSRMVEDPDGFARDVEKLLTASMVKATEFLVSEVVGPKGTLRNPPPPLMGPTIFTGQLVGSFGGVVVNNQDGAITTSVGSTAKHAKYMEDGTRPHSKHPPTKEIRSVTVTPKPYTRKTKNGSVLVKPKARKRDVRVSVLDKWIERKIGPKGQSAAALIERSEIAYLMGRKMKREGLKGRKYVARAIQRSGRKALAIVQSEYRKGLPKLVAKRSGA